MPFHRQRRGIHQQRHQPPSSHRPNHRQREIRLPGDLPERTPTRPLLLGTRRGKGDKAKHQQNQRMNGGNPQKRASE